MFQQMQLPCSIMKLRCWPPEAVQDIQWELEQMLALTPVQTPGGSNLWCAVERHPDIGRRRKRCTDTKNVLQRKWPQLAWDMDPGSVTILAQNIPILKLGPAEWEKLAGLEQIQELKDLDVDAEMRAGYRPM